MDWIVSFARGDEHQHFWIENPDGFVREVRTYLDSDGIRDFGLKENLKRLPFDSKERAEKTLDYDSLMKITKVYGKEISYGEYEKNFADGSWYTRPSLQTTFGSLRPMGQDFSGSLKKVYTMMFRPKDNTEMAVVSLA